MSLLEVKNLVKYYPSGGGVFSRQKDKVKAVDGVSFSLNRGETVGLVGESGCGKSTLGRMILRLEEPTAGKVVFNNIDLTGLAGKELRGLRKKIQIIFQDSYSSLNPIRTVGSTIGEPLVNFKVGTKKEHVKRVRELLETVGLKPEHNLRYPHEFSGGERQRINIARALALNPELVICDEPVSSLDVSIQAQILSLLQELKEQFGLSYLFISHDLAAVSHISDRVAVMYLGKIVEVLDSGNLEKACHPYTRALLAAVPDADPRRKNKKQIIVKGEPPDPANPPSGCRFHPRCPYAVEKCWVLEPQLEAVTIGRLAACHLASDS